MGRAFVLKAQHTQKTDLSLLVIFILLAGLGLSALFSASHFVAQRLTGNPYFFLVSQIRWVLVGGLGAVLLSQINLDKLRPLIPILLALSALLMIVTFFNPTLMGAKRWIVIGSFSFQPSELVKLSLIIYLAHMFTKPGYDITDFKRGLFPPLAVVLLFLALTLIQNDFSTMVFIALVAFSLFFFAGIQSRYIILGASAALPLSIFFVLQAEHRVKRILAFLNPLYDPAGSGFQTLASLRALGEGGFWGKGLGEGVRKLGGIPEVQADFILSSTAEEAGFFGILIIFSLFTLLFIKGIAVSMGAITPFRKYCGLGISISLYLQFLFNAGVVAGVLPTTGIPLPFFSAGGSSLMISFLMMGMLLGISRKEGGQG